MLHLNITFIFNTAELFSTASDAYEQQLTTEQKQQIHKTDKRTRIDGCQLTKSVNVLINCHYMVPLSSALAV